MTWILGGLAVVLSALLGVVTFRRNGWDADLHRMMLVALLVPWAVGHLALARLSRSASLNPLRRSLADASVLAADWVAPLVLAVALGACLLWARRLRAVSILLPLLGSVLVWWVTVPLYASAMMRGWLFVTEGLAGPWPFVYHLSASAFLAGWVVPTLGSAEGERAAPRPTSPTAS